MPVFDYDCTVCGGRFEEIVLCGDETEDVLPCAHCGSESRRVTVYSFHCNGLEDHQLESMEKALFTRKQRAAGHKLRQSDNPELRKRGEELRFKSHSSLRRFEESRGWRRLTPGTAEYKRKMDNLSDQGSDIRNIKNRDGAGAASEFLNKKDIQEKTGWDSIRYDRWKSMTDKVSEKTEVIDG